MKPITDYTRPGMRRLVREVVAVLATGEPTHFRYEGICRHALRSAFCLVGWSWPSADVLAADLVRIALELIGAERPPWIWGQPGYVEETVTRIGWTRCLNCGQRLDEDRSRFCSTACGKRYRSEFEKSLEAIAADRVRCSAAREAYRKAAKWRRCEKCERVFKPSYWGNRFCSRTCSGSRSFVEKQNGHAHPWLNGRKTGAAAVNGAGVSLETTATLEDCSAPAHARGTITTPSSHAIAPRPAPS